MRRSTKIALFGGIGLTFGIIIYNRIKNTKAKTWEAIEKASAIVASVTGNEFNPIDTLLGVALLCNYHRHPYVRSEKEVTDLVFLKKALRNMKYSSGAYGWSLLSLCFGKMPPSFFAKDNPNCEALRIHTGIEPTDVKEAFWEGETLHPAHYLAVDHQHKTVVLAISGTKNMEDGITDLNCDYTPFQATEMKTHSGFLTCALEMVEMLGPSLHETCLENPNYEICITGHSLGAGVAVLTACLMAEKYSDLNIECFAFGPPGVFSRPLPNPANCQTFSFINGDDWVPRASYGHAQELGDIIRGLLLQLDDNSKRLMHIVSSRMTNTSFSNETITEIIAKNFSHEPLCLEDLVKSRREKLLPPGQIFYVGKVYDEEEEVFTVFMEEAEPQAFENVVISLSMVTDHFIQSYEAILQQCVVHTVAREEDRGFQLNRFGS